MNIDLTNMVKWEREKAIYLLSVAEELGMNTSGYGELAVNNNSGYTYLWLEDYSFTLYMPINCELTWSDVYAMWTNPENGDEEEIELNHSIDLNDLNSWCDKLYANIEEEEEEV